MGDDGQDDPHTTKKTRNKSKKKQRKRKHRSRTETPSTEAAETVTRDNRKRSAPSSTPVSSQLLKVSKKEDSPRDDEAALDGPDVPLLEGAMVNDPDGQQQMVLVDKRNGMVYSTVQPLLPDGSRPRIGTWNNGQIQLLCDESQTHLGGGATNEGAMSFPFETDPDDHCESPLEAYQDIVPLLQAVADGKNGGKPKTPCNVRIYDPYYCNGSVVKHLNQLGFPKVHNQLEDCYEVWRDSTRYPDFDILVTNPPYSSHHMQELIRHLTSAKNSKNKNEKSLSLFPSNRPWMLLLPQWVHKKEYYLEATKDIQPFYLVPHKRYVYAPPASFRERKRSDTHKKSSPFVSIWYIWGGTMEQNSRWLGLSVAAAAAAGARQKVSGEGKEKRGHFDVARSKSALRDLRRKGRS